MRPSTKKPAGTPTKLNLWVLAKLFGADTEIENRISSVDAPHVRRCLKAGLVVVQPTVRGSLLVLTDFGQRSLAAHAAGLVLVREEDFV